MASKIQTRQLTSRRVQEALSGMLWDFGNQVLYDLCSRNWGHKRDDVIVAKVWLIGRAYAAAIERRDPATDSPVGDPFYQDIVAPKIRNSPIDSWFCNLAASPTADTASCLETHFRLMKLFSEISGRDQRSLASKYLHFHFPMRFYLYDSRAQRVIPTLALPVGRKLPTLREYDNCYARFFLRCLTLSHQIASLAGRHPTPRELDKVLLAYS